MRELSITWVKRTVEQETPHRAGACDAEILAELLRRGVDLRGEETQRLPGRGGDHRRHAGPAGRSEDRHGTEHVGGDGVPHLPFGQLRLPLAGQVDDQIRPHGVEDLAQLSGVTNVDELVVHLLHPHRARRAGGRLEILVRRLTPRARNSWRTAVPMHPVPPVPTTFLCGSCTVSNSGISRSRTASNAARAVPRPSARDPAGASSRAETAENGEVGVVDALGTTEPPLPLGLAP